MVRQGSTYRKCVVLGCFIIFIQVWPLMKSHQNPLFEDGLIQYAIPRHPVSADSGACLLHPSFCDSVYCIRSSTHHHIFIDFYLALFSKAVDATLLSSCHQPAGGQVGSNADDIEVSFIVTFKDNAERTVQCLAELFKTSREASSVEFVLVDDGSTADTSVIDHAIAVLRHYFLIRVKKIHNAQSQGYGGANSAGARLASGKYLVFLNNDAFVTNGWLRSLLDTFQSTPSTTGVVGPLFMNSTGWVMEAGGVVWSDGSAANFGRFETPQHYHLFRRPVDYISAACIMIKRNMFLEIGGFDPQYGLGYWEDTDLALSLATIGLDIVMQPMSVVIHDEGGSLSSAKAALMARNQRLFQQKWAATLRTKHCASSVPLLTASLRLAGQNRLLFIDENIPGTDRDSGSVRTLNMLRILLELGFQVSFHAVSSRDEQQRYENTARFYGVHVLPVGKNIVFQHKGTCMYEVIIVSRFNIYESVVRHIVESCPHAKVVFDTVDVHFLRNARLALTSKQLWNFDHTTGAQVLKWLLSDSVAAKQLALARDREVHLMNRSNVTLVVSSTEAKLLERLAPGVNVRVVSNIHDVDTSRQTPLGCQQRKGLLFVGNFNHFPNQQAVDALVHDVIPALSEQLDPSLLQGMTLHVVGTASSSARIPAGRQSKVKIKVHGWMSELELRLLYRSVKVVVAPLMSGAGVKGKLNQAMMYGVPVVATPIAAEGMHLVDGVDVMLATTPGQFVDKLLRLYTNCTLWDAVVKGGFSNIQEHFSMQTAAKQLKDIMSQLGISTGKHRPRCT